MNPTDPPYAGATAAERYQSAVAVEAAAAADIIRTQAARAAAKEAETQAQAACDAAIAHRESAVATLASWTMALEGSRERRVDQPGAAADEAVGIARVELAEAHEALADAEAAVRVHLRRVEAAQHAARVVGREHLDAIGRQADASRAMASELPAIASERLAAAARGAEQMIAELPIPASEYQPRMGEDDAERRERIRAARWRAFDRENERMREPSDDR